MADTPVLIIGAGPTGLMMACELARHGISFRIIDKKPERTLVSNATWIQTRTIEILDHIGIADRFLRIGHPCHFINLYSGGKLATTISLNHIESTYPFILMLPQSETEKILNERLEELNGHVERPLEFVDLIQKDKKIQSTIRHPDGQTEVIICDWLIGCGGAHSTVREKGQFLFPGKDLTEQFIVADAEIDSYMSKDTAHVFFDKETVFSAFPLGSNKYRITANLHLTHPRKFFSESEIIDIIQERAYGSFYAKTVSWISPFWIHSNLVKHMHFGSIFLAGDAAHIHSPLGGQGMNTGLIDAYNLAWKLALVIKDKAKLSLLDSYQSERHPIIKKVVNQTEKFTKMVLFDKSFLEKLRKFSDRVSSNHVNFSKKFGMYLTHLDVKYLNSNVIDYKIKKLSPKQGERTPDVLIDQKIYFYKYLQNTQHNILAFAGSKPTKNHLIKINKLQQWVDRAYSDLIKVHVISKSELPNVSNIILDIHGAIHDRYNVNKVAIYIVRPDNHIAFYSNKLDLPPIKRFFHLYLY